MKYIVKQLVMAAVVAVIAMPAIAADLNKGNKSYQVRNTKAPEQTVAATRDMDAKTTAADVANIAPAAGVEDAAPKAEKSMKEQIRLPRKN